LSTYDLTMKGRVGRIVEGARYELKSLSASYSDWEPARWLYYLNKCLNEIAQKGYWKASAKVDITAGVEIVDLTATYPDLIQVISIESLNGYYPVCKSWDQFNKYKWANVQAVIATGNTLQWTVAPSETVTEGLLMLYAISKPRLGSGIEIIPDLGSAETPAEFLDLTDDDMPGFVGISTLDAPNDLEAGDLFAISGSTNYDGQHTITSDTTASQIVIEATYAEEELTNIVKCGRYYTPPIPEANDDIFIAFCVKEFCWLDERRRKVYADANQKYEVALHNLIRNRIQGGLAHIDRRS
jgi:hypothetical protein